MADAICDNMSRSWDNYTKQNKPDRKKLRTVWFHLYVDYTTESNKYTTQTTTQTDNCLVVTRRKRVDR